MVTDQDVHADYVADVWRDYIGNKYRLGQAEHGGKLWRKALLGHMMEEVADLAIYLLTHKDQMAQLGRLLDDARSQAAFLRDEAPKSETLADLTDTIERCYALLTVGNEDGIEEEELNP